MPLESEHSFRSTLDCRERLFYDDHVLYVHTFETDVRGGTIVATRMLGAAGLVTMLMLAVVSVLALGFDVRLSRALSQALPLALAAAGVAALLTAVLGEEAL